MPIKRLFATGLPSREWREFEAEDFDAPVSGVIHRSDNPPVCGVPLGGIDTGCLDIEVTGLLGYATVFNSLFPRRGPLNLPFLGVSVKQSPPSPVAAAWCPHRQTWLLTSLNLHSRGDNDLAWTNMYAPATFYYDVRTCDVIHYWGHYPVVDMEFESTCPVSVGLRAWSPFIPGDVTASNTPGAVFEVHLRNPSAAAQEGTVALSFPGPTVDEAGTVAMSRRRLEGKVSGVELVTRQVSYVLGVIGEPASLVGGDLGIDTGAWQMIGERLPTAVDQPGASVAVNFRLEPGQERVVRLVLTWRAPKWLGGGTMTAGGNAYYHMYAARYGSALDAAEYLAENHDSLLRRILAWQQVLYGEKSLPRWLRDALVNVLHLITETSVWAQARRPIGEWCRAEDGVFGMCESPRWCPQIECIPCSFYGNLPLVYFFPQLALSTLRTYKAYQYPTGAAPWVFGGCTVGSKPYEMALPSPGYAKKPQTTLDGPCYAEMIDKMWQRTGDDAVLREFYDSMKRNVVFTMNLRPGSGDAGIVSMPTDNNAYDWFELCDLYGIVPHIGGAHLAQLRMAKRMAEAMGDGEFAAQCEDWLRRGSAVLEEHGWAGTHYLLFNELETGKRSDVVLAYQLDGEWMTRFHGLPGVFRPDRVRTTLETLERTSLAVCKHGAAVFCKPEGRDLGKDDWNPGYWANCGVHPPGTFMLGMTYMYHDQPEVGLEAIRRIVTEIMRCGWYWDWPVVTDASHFSQGRDYYQNLMLWSVPAALAGQDLAGPCRPDGLVDRIIRAGAPQHGTAGKEMR